MDIFIARVPDAVILSSLVFICGIFYGDLFSEGIAYLLMFLSLFAVIYGIYLANSDHDSKNQMQDDNNSRKRDAQILKLAIVSSITGGLIITLYFGALAFLFSLSCVVLFLLYNVTLKRILILKDAMVGFGFTIPLIYGALIHSGGIPPVFLYFLFLSFLAGFAIEILCDIRDMEEDTLSDVRTLPVMTSERFSAFTASALFAVIIVLDPLPFFWKNDGGFYGDFLFLLLISVPVATFASMIFSLAKDADPDNARRWVTYARPAMLTGCLAYVCGVIFQDQFISLF